MSSKFALPPVAPGFLPGVQSVADPTLEHGLYMEMALENAAESIVVTDTLANIVYVNAAFERTTGYSRGEVIGGNARLLKSGAHSREFYSQMWRVLRRGERWSGIFVNKRKDGSLFQEEASISPVFDTTGRIANYVAVKRDLTRERQLEQELREVQKMEALGRLASGIAHDFNNLLTVIQGYSELLEQGAIDRNAWLKSVQQIQKASRSAAALTRQLLAFGSRRSVAPYVLDANTVVKETETMLRRLLPGNIRLKTKLEPAGAVRLDPSQLQQVLLNLVVNARDAMPDGGALAISTEKFVMTSDYFSSHGYVRMGEYMLLTVADTGVGMSPEVQASIFKPFFTTKPIGKGVGLGLATVYGIVKQSSGYIHVYSEPGAGTTFKIYFPLVQAEAQTAEEATQGREGARECFSGRALVVEDDDDLRAMLASLLGAAGFRVVEAASAEEAEIRAAQEPPDLLVTDVALPGDNGVALAVNLSLRLPRMKTILTSGYHEHRARAASVDGGIFLDKPFTHEELMGAIAGLFNRAPEGATPQSAAAGCS